MTDNLMAGVLDSKRRRKGWHTSGDNFSPEKLRPITDEFLKWYSSQKER